MTDESLTTDELQARLIAKAWEDETFKQDLLSDPRATIERELGVELPYDLEIEVVEETPTKIFLVVPVRPDDSPQVELSDEDLKAVAGGFGELKTQPYTATRTARAGGFGRLAAISPTLAPARKY